MEKRKKSNTPIYAFGITWLIFAIATPTEGLAEWTAVFIVSLIAYAIASMWVFANNKFKAVKNFIRPSESAEMPEKTGNTEVDAVIEQGRQHIQTLKNLNIAIVDEKMSKQIDELVAVSRQIFSFIAENPDNIRQINKFMEYYFPEAIKLLTTYKEMALQQVKVEQMHITMQKIESVMDSVVAAFKDQLDKLYQHKALDTKTDIDVLKSMLAQEGLEK